MSEVLVTIGVAARNEASTIGECIRILLGEMHDVDSELIVVAGGEDGTADRARQAMSGCRQCRLVDETAPRGKPAALNTISSMARGRIVVLTDGDVIVKPGSLNELLELFSDANVGAATGRVVGKQGTFNLIEEVCDYTAKLMDAARGRDYPTRGTVRLASGYLIAARRELMPEIPEGIISDDGYISAHIRSKGFRIAYTDGAEVQIIYPDNLVDFLRQKSRTRFGHIQVGEVFPDRIPRRFRDDISQQISMISEVGYPGARVLLASAILAGLSWAVAYLRYRLPKSFARDVWVRIESTKRL
jgi:cellulose synthase/poly-beta-1,6-N-acetylglucosamine synthase-like glycosyltransferase